MNKKSVSKKNNIKSNVKKNVNKDLKKKNKVEKKNFFDLDNQRNRLIILSILVVFFLLALWLNNYNDKNNSVNDNNVTTDFFYNNVNPGVVEDKVLDGLKFTNTSLIYSEYSSSFKTLVTNTTDSDFELKIFDIYVKDEKGNEIVKLVGYVGEVIPKGESREIESKVDMSLKNASSIEYKVVE